jgi:uncharacterized protein YbbC (DUF1343 family)
MKTVVNGVDRLKHAPWLKGKRLGLVASPSGVTFDLRLTLDVLYENYHLTALYAPEHGARGEAEAGERVASYTDTRTGKPVYSLYGDTKKPTPEMLDNIDMLIMDVQDIGCRYYTFLSTLRLCMEACAENGKAFAVFDRPNPIGGLQVEGNLVQEGFISFVGCAAIPTRHGLTLGELATMMNEEYTIGCELYVLPTENWRRGMYADETGLLWVNPSPNMPCLDAAVLYPGTCLFEGTNISEGRGTTKPFETAGAPWLDGVKLADSLNKQNLDGVLFRPVYFKPAFSKHAGVLCGGVQAHITDKKAVKPVQVGLCLLETIKEQSGEKFEWLPFIDLLAGCDLLQKENGFAAYRQLCETEAVGFMKKRERYFMY